MSNEKPSDPIIAGRQPQTVRVAKGDEYSWCACGRSRNQPFCDGSHAGTGLQPVAFRATESSDAALCMCKRTYGAPYCDGTHATPPADAEADAGVLPASVEPGTVPAATPTPEEPTVRRVHDLAEHGLEQTGHHGDMVAMGVPRPTLPQWDDIQILAAQFARKPLLDTVEVGTELVIGSDAKKPLVLKMPLFVSDMSFGSLSEEAKTALARGADRAGTGICSGEGGMLPEEQAENKRYFYELASAKFGYEEHVLTKVQAFHFKGGQGAKTGTGGHLPANKVVGKIAQVRGLSEGVAAVSPATFEDLTTVDDFRTFSNRVREVSGGIPIGMKLSANHIEEDIAFAIDVG